MLLDVRETQKRAIQVYDQLGYQRWGSNPRYALIDGEWMVGHYYFKDILPGTSQQGMGEQEMTE